MNNNKLRILGFTATLIAVASQLLQGWTDEKKMQNHIDECVGKKFEEMNNENDVSAEGEES